MSTPIKVFETLLLSSKTGFSGTDTQPFYVVSGSRLVVSINIIAIDPGTTITLDIDNSFTPDDGYLTLDSINASATGWYKKVVTDFHSVFQIVTTVTGGNATYKIGISVIDNASSTTLTSTQRDLSDATDAIRLGDGTNQANVTVDHELEVHDQGLIDAISSSGAAGAIPNKLITSAFVITTAGTEQAFTVPAGARNFLLRVRGTTAKLMISGSSGGTVYNYITIERGVVFNSGDLVITVDTLFYINSDVSGTVVEFLTWSFQ